MPNRWLLYVTLQNLICRARCRRPQLWHVKAENINLNPNIYMCAQYLEKTSKLDDQF